MVYKRCEVRDCKSVSTGPCTKSFFKILLKNSTRDLDAWKAFCGVEQFSSESYICSDHFGDADFTNPLNKSQGLRATAFPSNPLRNCPDAGIEGMILDERLGDVPDIGGENLEIVGEVIIGEPTCDPEIPLQERRTNQNKTVTSIEHDHAYLADPGMYVLMAEKMVELEEQNLKLKQELRKTKQNMCRTKNVVTHLREELTLIKFGKRLKKITGCSSNTLSDPILVELQKNKERKCRGARYSDSMKNMAVVLQYCSTKAYRHMRKLFALPGLSTIRRWLGRIDIKEGFSTTVLKLLKMKSAFLDHSERLVTLFVDEMAITERVTYVPNAKPDYFSGFPTKLPGEHGINVSVRAKSSLTLMIKTLKSGFKQAIGYFFCCNLKSTDLKLIIDKAIALIVDAGFIPKVITCDQNSTNRALFTNCYGISEQKPYFEVDILSPLSTNGQIESNRVYCMYDAPHLHKSCRNNILKHNAMWDGNLCTFQHIVDLYWEDVKNVPRSVPGLTYDHIKLAQFTEMNVSLAAQTLSYSVTAGLKEYVRTGKLPTAALNTASFCEDFDKLFDVSNSLNFNEKKALKRPIKSSSPHWSFLDSMQKKLRSLYFVDKCCTDAKQESQCKPLMKNSKHPYFVEGWILYIAALKELWNELNKKHEFWFLRTRNLSQDCLEHFFSVIRWRNGNNTHPDTSEFSSAYKAVVINQLLVPKKIGNVQADISKYLVSSEDIRQLKIVDKQPSRFKIEKQEETCEDYTFDENQISSVHWTTGWACSKIKHEACLKRVTSGSENVPHEQASLSAFKRYNEHVRINTPGENIFKYFQGVCKIFERNFQMLLAQDTVGVKEELMDIIQVAYKFPNVQVSAESTNSLSEDEPIEDECSNECLIMDVICMPCALRITDKYLNMLIFCKLAQMNSEFHHLSDEKKKCRKSDKAKKLNISRLSDMMLNEPSSSIQMERKKKTRTVTKYSKSRSKLV